ncbi:MAG: hypothetical protein ABMA14_14385 [Hyphomonadaceae bacterium]
MRRLFAIMLIATSGWLLHQTMGFNFGGAGASFWTELARQADKPAFLIPTIGGALCLLGGLTVFFGGPGGAALALLGGLAVAGFGLTVKETFKLEHIWDNELTVGVLMLMLAAMTASISRASDARKTSWDEQDDRSIAPRRRIY